MGTQRATKGLAIYLRDRVRHGCRARDYRDVFTACPGGRSSSPTPYLNIEHLGLSNVIPHIGALPKCYERGWPSRTRRKYIPIGSGAASLLHTVREGLPHSQIGRASCRERE